MKVIFREANFGCNQFEYENNCYCSYLLTCNIDWI